MNNTRRADSLKRRRVVAITATLLAATMAVSQPLQTSANQGPTAPPSAQALSLRQLAIAPVTAAAAIGDMAQLNAALSQGLDAGLTVSDAKEVLVQLYAYAGFPRSLNALGELMKVLDARKQGGIQDAPGRDPGTAIPTGKALLALGTANQTQLLGAPASGPLYQFVPVIDEYLKTHLFGDIFARDNLDWRSRELATVGVLAALTGVEPQLQAHIRISMNVGLTAAQLRNAADALARRGQPEAARRMRSAIESVEAASRG